MMTEIFLTLLGGYLLIGLIFAVPFAFFGVHKIDSHATRYNWGFRFLIIPGTMALWPILSMRWMKGIHAPPEESNAHRCLAHSSHAKVK